LKTRYLNLVQKRYSSIGVLTLLLSGFVVQLGTPGSLLLLKSQHVLVGTTKCYK
jgi:hypothetical protein